MRGDDEPGPRRAGRRRRRTPRGEEEVRVHDVGPEAPRQAHRAGREAHVLRRGAAVWHGVGELVTAPFELVREVGHEDAMLGRSPGRVHLGDEQDSHD